MLARALHWPGSSANRELKVVPNKHLCAIIFVIWDTTNNKEYNDNKKTSTHLDSHANMTIAGCHATMINKSEKSADVRPFSKDCSKIIAVPIVDVATEYDFPYSGITYIIIIKNALYVPSMNHNLVPPFIMREAGLIVNDIPRIHTRQEDLTNQTHCIVPMVDGDENSTNFNIHMKLDGIFSYFPTRKLTMDELEECEYMETVYLIPDADQWNPYDEEYAESEDSF